jgi:hypothetical protein
MKRKKFITIDALALEFFGMPIGISLGVKVEKEAVELMSEEEEKALKEAFNSVGQTIKQITQGNKKLKAWILDKEEPKEKDCENCDEKERCEKMNSMFDQLMEDLRK